MSSVREAKNLASHELDGLKASSLSALRHLAEAVSSSVWWNPYKPRDEVRAKLRDALVSPRTLEAVEAAFFDHSEEECATELAEAADKVRNELQQGAQPLATAVRTEMG